MAIDLTPEEAKLLAGLGFLGLSRGLADQAQAVFAALAALRPEQEVGPLGLALSDLAAERFGPAVERLRRAPQSEAVVAFRVVAHARFGEREVARALCQELEAGGAPVSLLEMARGALAA